MKALKDNLCPCTLNYWLLITSAGPLHLHLASYFDKASTTFPLDPRLSGSTAAAMFYISWWARVFVNDSRHPVQESGVYRLTYRHFAVTPFRCFGILSPLLALDPKNWAVKPEIVLTGFKMFNQRNSETAKQRNQTRFEYKMVPPFSHHLIF